jgi:hypothetical protein
VSTLRDLADEAESDPDQSQNSEVSWVCSRDGDIVLDFHRANLEGSESTEGGGPVASVEEILSESIRRYTERAFESSTDDSPSQDSGAE